MLALSGLCVAFALSWGLLASMNFSYGFWHDYGGIGWAIDEYGDDNQFRFGFHLTSKAQREALFAGIAKAIQNDGVGLEDLEYQVPGYEPQKLLREPEVVHLVDVAHLVNKGMMLAAVAGLIWLVLWLYFFFWERAIPSLKRQVLSIFALMAFLTLLVLLIGPVKIFYVAHEWVFPENHQWFFYYQESLMSTMMYAPYIFGWIALEWVVFALLIFPGLQLGVAKLLAYAGNFKKGKNNSQEVRS